MIHKFSLAIILFLVAACASTHPGISGKSLALEPKIPLKLSAKNVEEEESDSFQLLEVTIENTSSDWVKISKVQYLISDPGNSKLSVVLGQDLKNWAEAAVNKQKVEKQNKEMMQIGLMSIGAAAAIAGTRSQSDLGAAGDILMLGSYGWVLTDAISSSISGAEKADQIPESHLYHPTSVPGKMFLRRWILINKPADSVVKTMRLEIETIEGVKETYAFNF